METPMVDAKKISRKVGNEFLFKNIDWQINMGENWIIFGENGCGKTSLLSAIAGVSSISDGQLFFNGEVYSAENIAKIYKQVRFVSSSFLDKCFIRESALEIVLSGINGDFHVPYEVTAADIRHAKDLFRKFRMIEIINHPYDLLSKGQRQCVLLIRAFMEKSSLLILDEPTAGLDIVSRAQVLATLKELCALKGLSLIFVTHQADEIFQSFEHCMLMRRGQIYSSGFTNEILDSDIFSQYFQRPLSFSWNREGQAKIAVNIGKKDILVFK